MVTKFVAHFMMILLLLLTNALLLAEAACSQNKCGNVSIPYPFGIGPDCYMNEGFALSCVNTSSHIAKPFITSLALEVLEISLTDHTVRVNYPILSKNCYGDKQANITNSGILLTGTPFSFSNTRNRFTALGCNNLALMISYDGITIGGCVSTCNTTSSESGCYGVNCCQTSIPPSLKYFNASLRGIDEKDDSLECKYAFLVDQEWFSNSSTNVFTVKDMEYVPAVFDWAVSGVCDSLGKNASGTTNGSATPPTCSTNAFCVDDGNGSSTHFCRCRFGYKGNAYASHGCQDINECEDFHLNICSGRAICVNEPPGSYSCFLPDKPRSPIGLILGISIGVGVLLLLIFTSWLYKAIQRRKRTMLKKKFFKRNGGLLLEKQLASGEGNVDQTKLFTSKELDKATDHYNEDRILGQGGQGTVYKGMLTDGRIVAVKKSKLVDEAKLEQFINEVVILSQINHRNVVKLFGCCLETEVPMLVYEFIPKGTLLQYIHEKDEDFPFSWAARLRIACEVAGALFYLHSAASIPIYHRDIKSSNILLDDNYRAKVSDFGTSRSIATDKTHLTTLVQGTFGYLDPEYFQSSQFTEKSDVYSFGVVLVELFTGEKAISSVRSQEGRSLATYFIHSMMENRLFDILDDQVKKEAANEDIMAVANLALRCLNLNGKNRPTMKEVAMVLEGVKRPQGGGGGDLTNLRNYEEFDYSNVAEIIAVPWDDTSTSTGSRLDNSVSSSLDVQPLLLNRS